MGFHHHYWDWRFSPSSAYQISNWIKICLPLSYSLFIIVLIIAWISLRTTSRPRMWSKTACRKGSVSRINFNLSRCHNKTRDSSQARMLTYIKHQISNSTFVSSWWEKKNLKKLLGRNRQMKRQTIRVSREIAWGEGREVSVHFQLPTCYSYKNK